MRYNFWFLRENTRRANQLILHNFHNLLSLQSIRMCRQPQILCRSRQKLFLCEKLRLARSWKKRLLCIPSWKRTILRIKFNCVNLTRVKIFLTMGLKDGLIEFLILKKYMNEIS